MTKDELIGRQRAFRSSLNKWSAGFLVVFFGIIFANIPLAAYLKFASSWILGIYLVAFFVFLVATIPLMWWFQRRQQRRFGVVCPHCGAPLVGTTGQITVATGHCGICGEKLFSET